MKRYYVLLTTILFTVLFLSGCSSDLSILEQRVREFDYYTEIVDYRQTSYDSPNFKLVVAYNDNSSEVTYIYYMENVQNDQELLFKLDGEVIYEDFIVREYSQGEDFIGEFKGSSLQLEDAVTKVEMFLNPPGIAWSDSITQSVLFQEVNIIQSTDQLDALYRHFVSTENYLNRDIEIAKDTIVTTRLRNVFLISVATGVGLYFMLLRGYKGLYQWAIQKRLSNQTFTLKLMDIQLYKYVSAIALFILIIITNIIGSNLIYSRYDKVDFYTDYNVNYEETISDTINLTYGGTYQFDQNIAFVEKGSTHNIMGYLYITLEDGLITAIPEKSYGGYNYIITYRFITSSYIQVQVKEWNTDTDDIYLEDILTRKLYFDTHR